MISMGRPRILCEESLPQEDKKDDTRMHWGSFNQAPQGDIYT